ncbi:thioredoxin family protein [Engelhardtia mirabilis]|uniref:Disulfide bond reductase DsbH n=1 Tax=Engelhardtia mirabilis TaxID=2528011 RepID=A0A518BHB0_9BACT|nr:Disulfide bond reductase DsbH precursor [Planctomycetes bacterium Pla133]QDV00697.1 Disulfide bond reductase DsbH precursor [Planctomycetes bacterium Pla86]
MRLNLGVVALAIAPSLAIAGQEPAAESPWYADFDVAAAAAKEQGKDLFVDFTGSDWCGWCIKLDGEVFEHEEFLAPAQEQFVLLKLDFPNSEEVKAKVPNPDRNDELSKLYGIRGFPTVLLMTADGTAYASTGYRDGGPEKYVEHLTEIRAEGRAAMAKVDTVIKAFEDAQPDKKAEALEGVFALLAELDGDSPFVSRVTPIVRQAFTIDAANEAGLKLRALSALLEAGVYDDEIKGIAIELDPRNAEGLIEKALVAQMRSVASQDAALAFVESIAVLDGLELHDAEDAFMLYGNAASWGSRFGEDAEAAAKYARKALAIGNEDPGYAGFIDALREIAGDEVEVESQS